MCLPFLSKDFKGSAKRKTLAFFPPKKARVGGSGGIREHKPRIELSNFRGKCLELVPEPPSAWKCYTKPLEKGVPESTWNEYHSNERQSRDNRAVRIAAQRTQGLRGPNSVLGERYDRQRMLVIESQR